MATNLGIAAHISEKTDALAAPFIEARCEAPTGFRKGLSGRPPILAVSKHRSLYTSAKTASA
jgi:hypothetical protein